MTVYWVLYGFCKVSVDFCEFFCVRLCKGTIADLEGFYQGLRGSIKVFKGLGVVNG